VLGYDRDGVGVGGTELMHDGSGLGRGEAGWDGGGPGAGGAGRQNVARSKSWRR